jgi:hypothetical protein
MVLSLLNDTALVVAGEDTGVFCAHNSEEISV